MTDPINTLMNEHRLIESVLVALGNYSIELEEKGTADRGKLLRFAEFFQQFADKFHHGKEEDILFAEMAHHGFSPQFGPVAAMLMEHEMGRKLVRSLQASGEKTGQPWSEEEIRSVVDAARQFIAMLAAHIQKEDQILYPMAQQHIPYTMMVSMGDLFTEYDSKKNSDGTHQRLVQLAEELTATPEPVEL